MAFNTAKPKRIFLEPIFAGKTPQWSYTPTQVMRMTTITPGAAGASNSLIPAGFITWPLPCRIILERFELSAMQTDPGLTDSQRVACRMRIEAPPLGWVDSVAPGFPDPAQLLLDGYTYPTASIEVEFSADETLRDYRGAEIVLVPQVYDIRFEANGVFLAGDTVRFSLAIFYRLSFLHP